MGRACLGPAILVITGLLAGCERTTAKETDTSGSPSPDADTDTDTDTDTASPPGAPLAIGTHHITESWPEQSILDDTQPGFLRVNIPAGTWATWTTSPERIDWDELDEVILGNGDRLLLVTVYASHSGLSGDTEPKIPETTEELESFDAWVGLLAERYGAVVEAWQLANEVDSSDKWPPDRFADYATLLSRFRDTIHTHSPEARLAVAGISGAASTSIKPAVIDLLTAIAAHDPTAAQIFDLHSHRSWTEAELGGDRVSAYREALAAEVPALGDIAFILTESSTWVDDPESSGDGPQTEDEQAAHAAASTMAALGAGAEWCVVGVPMDRVEWMGEDALHKYNLNGLFYNPDKTYSDGTHEGPKKVAWTTALLAHLVAGHEAGDITGVSTANPDLRRVEITAGGEAVAAVTWWTGEAPTTQEVPTVGDGDTQRVQPTIPVDGAAWPPDDLGLAFPSTLIATVDGTLTLTLAPHVPVILLAD